MFSQSTGTGLLPPTASAKPGMPCACSMPCPDPVLCAQVQEDRERRASESTWIRESDKRARWVLANGVTV